MQLLDFPYVLKTFNNKKHNANFQTNMHYIHPANSLSNTKKRLPTAETD